MKRSRDVQIDEKVEFSSLIQNAHILQGLKNAGYEQPSPVQLKVIPLGRLGVDVIAQAKSGTGKTVVFSVIALEAVQTNIKAPQVLILAPTREIAVQIRDVIRQIGAVLSTFRCEAFIGGLANPSTSTGNVDAQVVVGTPGRIMSLIQDKKLSTARIRLLVLDEADKLMSDNFPEQVESIVSKLPKMRQSVAFSATFTIELLQQLRKYVPKDPQLIRLTDGVPTLEEVQQYYVQLKMDDEEETAANNPMMVYRKKFEEIENILGKVPFYQCMIFVNNIPRAKDLEAWLNDMGWATGFIHAGLSQEKRLSVMERMRDFRLRIMVCSDLIARGIDIDRVNLVINLDFPRDIETYLHRVGRTGRYGTSGIAVSLVCGSDDIDFLDRLKSEQIVIQPLPDNVTYNEFKKELTENEQTTLLEHESKKVESKPIKLKNSNKRGVTNVDQKASGSQKRKISGTNEKTKRPNPASSSYYSNVNFDLNIEQQQQATFGAIPNVSTLYPFPAAAGRSIPLSSQQRRQQRQQWQRPSLSWKPFIPPDLFF